MATKGLLSNKKSLILGVEELPQCGRNDEVLEYHGLSAQQIAKKIIQNFHKK